LTIFHQKFNVGSGVAKKKAKPISEVLKVTRFAGAIFAII